MQGKLIDAIIEYAEFTGRLGIIVFDAYNIKSCKEKIEKRKNNNYSLYKRVPNCR